LLSATTWNLAIAWLIAQPNSGDRVREMLNKRSQRQAADIQLSPDQVQEIDAIGRIVTDHLDGQPVMWNNGILERLLQL